MSTVKDLTHAIGQLGTSPGRRPAHQLEALSVSRYTLEHNFRQLETFAADLEGDARTVRGIARRSPDTCEFVLGESVRLTHNYVAAAMTLVAHTRNVERELFDSVGGLSGCQDRIDRELSSDPLVQFLKRLRVFSLHCRPVTPGVTVKRVIHGKGPTTYTLSLDAKSLLEWDDWTAPARSYIDSCGAEVPLLETCQRYRDKVFEFTDWFEGRVSEEFRSELDDYQTKLRAFHLAEIRDLVARGDVSSEDSLDECEDMIFAGVLTTKELSELAAAGRGSNERLAAALRLLAAHIPVSDGFRRELTEWYKRVSGS